MRHRQVDEDLIVGVFADAMGAGGSRLQRGVLVEVIQDFFWRDRVALQARGDVGVGQHILQFVAHGLGGYPLQASLNDGLLQRREGGVVEDEEVENDIGIKYEHCP